MTTKSAPRILIVDDEPSIVDALSARLRCAGFIVDEAGTGRRALALAQEDPPDSNRSNPLNPSATKVLWNPRMVSSSRNSTSATSAQDILSLRWQIECGRGDF